MQEFLVGLGRDFCDKSRPDCFHCPLNIYLPEDGALGLPQKSAPTQKSAPRATQPAKVPAVSPRLAELPPKPAELPSDLNETERVIVEAIGEEPMPIDDVVAAVQLPVHIVRATIAVLQMKKLVRQVEGNQVRRS
jgi:predicted Rossmann fold nucleotide-binding protein DprA/Smf involved in DNA uptake